MYIKELIYDICDALNERRSSLRVFDGVYSYNAKTVSVTVATAKTREYSLATLRSINPKHCDGLDYIAYVFYVSLLKYGFEVKNVLIND